MSCEMIHGLCEGWGKYNTRKYQTSSGEKVEALDSVPDISAEDQAFLQQHLGGYYGTGQQ